MRKFFLMCLMCLACGGANEGAEQANGQSVLLTEPLWPDAPLVVTCPYDTYGTSNMRIVMYDVPLAPGEVISYDTVMRVTGAAFAMIEVDALTDPAKYWPNQVFTFTGGYSSSHGYGQPLGWTTLNRGYYSWTAKSFTSKPAPAGTIGGRISIQVSCVSYGNGGSVEFQYQTWTRIYN